MLCLNERLKNMISETFWKRRVDECDECECVSIKITPVDKDGISWIIAGL